MRFSIIKMLLCIFYEIYFIKKKGVPVILLSWTLLYNMKATSISLKTRLVGWNGEKKKESRTRSCLNSRRSKLCAGP